MKLCGIETIRKLMRRYQALSLPAKAALWFTMCYIVQRGIQFVCMPVFTRIMPSAEYGIYTTFLSWVNLISVFTSLGIYGNVFNKAMIKYENRRKEYVSSIQCLTAVCTVIFIMAAWLLHMVRPDMAEARYLCMMAVYLFFFPTVQYWYQTQRFEFKYKALVFVTLFITLSGILLGIAGAVSADEKGMALIAAVVISQSAAGIVLFIRIAVAGKVFYKKEFWYWSVKLAVPLIPGSLSEILLGHADRIMIRYLCGASQAAIYTTIYQISMAVTIIRMGINGAYIPWLYYSLQNKEYDAVRKVIRFVTSIFAGLTILIMMAGPELVKIAAPKPYYEAVMILPAVMLGCFFVSVYYLLEQAEVFYEKVIFSTVVSITGAVINMILNFIFIKRAGYLAAGYTTMVTYAIMAVMHAGYVIYLSRKNEKMKYLFDFRYLIFLSSVLIGIGAGCLILYQMFFIIRLGIIIFMLVMLYWNRKKIADLISMMRRGA